VRALRRWFLGAVALLLLLASVAGTLWWAVATEDGTRWLISQAIGYADVDVEVEGLSGSLRDGVGAEFIVYADDGLRVELQKLGLDIDWPGTSLLQIGIIRLGAERLTVRSLGEADPDPVPFKLDIPPLPVRVSVAQFTLGSVDVDEVFASGIEIREIEVNGLRAQLASAVATVETYQLQVSDVDAQLRDDLPLSAGFNWAAADASWSGEGSVHGSLGNLEFEHALQGQYPLRSAGTLDLLGADAPVFDVVSTFDEWTYENWVASDANVRLTGTLQDYRSQLSVQVNDGGQMAAQVRGELSGNMEALTSVDLAVDAFEGSAHVTGSAQWSPALAADLVLVGADMDFAGLTSGFATDLDYNVRFTATSAERFALDIRELGGTYNDQPIVATGTASRDGDLWHCRACDAAIGANHLKFDLAVRNQRLDGKIDIDAPLLQQLHPDIAGTMRATGQLRGRIDLPILSGDLSASDLKLQGWSIGALTIVTSSATPESVDVGIEIGGLANQDIALGGGDFRITGQLDQLNVESRWAAEGVQAEFTADLAQEEDTISGRMHSARIDHSDTGEWDLSEPVGFVLTPESLTVDAAKWSNGDTRLDIGRVTRSADSLSVEVMLSGAPLQWLDARTPREVTFGGYADGQLTLQESGGEWTGELEWRQRETLLRFDSGGGDQFEVAVPVAEMDVSTGPIGASLRAQLEADGDTAISLEGKASSLSPDATIAANLSARGTEWDWVSAFIPEIEEVVGTVRADFTASGRADSPELEGELRLSDGAVVLPAFNVPITSIDARVRGDSSGSLTVVGEAAAGSGSLAITGTISDLISMAPSVVLTVRGDEATVLDWPDYALVASPDLSLQGAGNRYRVGGRVRLDRAEIAVRELPEGAVRPSADVRVEGREEAERQVTRLTGEFDIELDESVHVRAFGLDTNLEGQLRISLPENQDPRANGEVSLIGGSFEMYGQRLEIERGTMLFSGPLDNPFVDVRAVRSIDGRGETVRVGLDIVGRADALSSTLFSDPAMTEAEVLSYLVTGRPLSQAGSMDGQLMSDAAFALGLRQAAAITNQVGQSVGLDELTLEGSNQDAAELVAGKQISPKLFARYRYGVFSRLGELLLNYSLTESLSVELGTGEFEWIDIQYTIERE
jgi:translocation and assembly module TamB